MLLLRSIADKHTTTAEEGITRMNTGVICGGLMLASDDYGIPAARERSRRVLTNEEVNAVARKGGAFRPVSGARGEFAADVFMRQEEDAVLVEYLTTACRMNAIWKSLWKSWDFPPGKGI